MKTVIASTGILLTILLAGCGQSSLDRRYLDASTASALELPPDLTVYEDESKFELPAIFSGDGSRDKLPVLAKVDSLRLQGSIDFYWLSVQAPVDNLYQLVRNFWASEGYRLELDEPVIGVMQTEWVHKNQGGAEKDQSWFARLFSSEDLSASQDQFKTRIERDEAGQRSRIYITHRATEYVHTISAGPQDSVDGTDNEWHFRQPEPELEVEMLSRLMIYLGLQQDDVEAQLADIKLFSPRAFMHIDAEENSPYLLLKDAYPIAWNRVYHQLERLNFEIAGAEFDSGIFNEGTIMVNTEIVEGKQNSGLFSLFSSSESSNKKIVLVIEEETHKTTRVTLETLDGDLDSSAEGAKFLTLLYQNIR